MSRRIKRWLIILTALLTGAFITLILLNLFPPEYKIQYRPGHHFAVDDPQFLRSMGLLMGPPVLQGNKVTSLQNGDQIFPAMLEAIRGARETITFETYIYWSGKIGAEFSQALSERARAGVKVHVLLDWVGSGKMEQSQLDEMLNAGVELERYRPLSWYHLSRFNNRTHRKLLVVDGKIGFTGGVGIADFWLGNAATKEEWRDSHYRIEGPAVAQMQSAFNDNWVKTRSKILLGAGYFPEIETAGNSLAQVFKSSRQEGSEHVHMMYLLSIASSTRHIRLAASYFVPDALSIETFIAARKRGVKIEVIVPGPDIDAKIVRSASRSLWGPLLDAGVEIYEYQPTMFHCKVFIVDDLWVSVGSTNFDNRSFQLNDEANLNVYDAEFAAEQVRVFEEDKSKSRRISRAELKNRPFWKKGMDWLSGLFRRQL